MSSLSRELVFLILQFLDEEKFKETVHKLEQESGFFFNMKHFEDQVQAGEWDEVERYLCGFTKVEDNRYSMKIFFEIRKQKYLEALDRIEQRLAVEILVKDLKNIMLVELKKLIEENPVFRDKLAFPAFKSSRLRTLINQRITFTIGMGLLLAGAALNDRHDEVIVKNDGYYCYVIKPGVLICHRSCLGCCKFHFRSLLLSNPKLEREGHEQCRDSESRWHSHGTTSIPDPEFWLEQESDFFFNMKHFEDQVQAGEWDEVERYLRGFTKDEDNPCSTKIFFEIRKQKYLEALDK
ncbi:hypothetical protein CXB51_020804 [Gossypium anomalum]|uniref:CTLH domain-containing protein n=1 Tax=Gossypium anomalum TaxID=47600 RepID=A0A8J6D0V5_9ROSI|nr:hypothetical protein CXB51_020804 [Gossypium anomalum]